MEIFYRLLFGHFLADFTLQTNFIANWKRRKFVGLLVHVALHPLCYLVLTWPYLPDVWASFGSFQLNGWSCVGIATLLHFIEDWFRVTMVNRGWPDNTFFYVWDQVIHIIVLFLLTPWRTQALENTWPIMGTLFVVVTHFATVTIWFIEKDIYGREYPATEEKYVSILQRLVVWISFLLPSPWWFLVPLFMIGAFVRQVWTRRLDFSWASVFMGNVIAVFCGLFARFGLNIHF